MKFEKVSLSAFIVWRKLVFMKYISSSLFATTYSTLT